MDVLRDLTHPRSSDAAYSPPFALPTYPLPAHDPAAMPPPASPIPPCGVAPSLVHHRPPLAPHSPNTPFPAPAVPSSSAKPAASARRKPVASKASSKASSRAPPSLAGDTGDEETNPDGTPLYLAPDYTANPAGPASSADVDFKCPQCDKVYRGKHARSIWRRHLQDKHGIPLSQQPRRTRWDTDASRPKSEEEKRARTLDSKRRWARKNRAEKGGKPSADSAPAPSLSGSVGTPASEQSSEQAGANGGDDEGDSSFDAGSVSGWSDGARGGSAPVHAAPTPTGAYGVAPSNPFYGAGGASVYGRTPTKHGYGPPGLLASGGGAMDPYLAGLGRPPLRATASMPPVYAHDDPRAPLHLRDANSYDDGPSPGPGPVHPHTTQYTYGPSNPYSHPFFPPHQQVAQEQPHVGAYPPPASYDEYGQPLNPALLSASSAVLPPRRPSSNPTFGGASTNPYDHPAGASPVVTAGQPAPVALPYYARRHGSPARHLAAGHSGIAAGVPIPSSSARESRAAAGGLESPVKLRRTGKGKEPSAVVTAGGRDDAAGILLALKAGPSSPMTGPAHVQSPVSSVRDQGERRGLLLGRGARAGVRRSDVDDEEEESDDDDEAEVRAMMLRSRAASGALSPWRAALQNQQPAAGAGAAAPIPAPVVSPRKRGRSESPALNLASTSSGEGSTAAAHALLATAKKAHQYAGVAHGGHPLRGSGPAWDHGMSLVATPTPGNLMRIAMESSPVVRFGGGGGGGVGAEGEPESEADLIGGAGEDDDGEGEVDAFTSSSGGARRPRRGRSVSPSSQKGRRRVPGAGGSSSSGAGGASSSSQPRVLHHHHPVGLTSELGDFDLQHSSSSSAPRQHHHHHDPLREHEASMGAAHPGSSSSASSHLVTPAPTSSRTTTSVAAAAAAAALAHAHAHAQPAPATHPHDPFLAAPGTSAALPLTMAGAGASEHPVARTSSPPGGFSSFLFSSPAHPQFSKTLGLTAAPGPGVLYTGAGGETPARSGGAGALAALGAGAPGRSREPSQDELLALAIGNSRERERMDAMKTPVMARVALEGARRAAAAAGGGMHPSDYAAESTEEEEGSATTGTTGRDESQSPGKATLDDEEDDDEEDGASLDD
ncbi:hypothetical protein JCM10450v2_003370 [Rhodotorula kratochvilovae]